MSALKIGFIGIGNMGGPMSLNLAEAGHHVTVFDLSKAACAQAEAQGLNVANSLATISQDKDVIITMLPNGEIVKNVYLNDVLPNADTRSLLIDSSTIDMTACREIHDAALAGGFSMLDAPVSGGINGAKAGSLAFMVGGTSAAFELANPVLEIMGAKIVHCGDASMGQAAKVCNNMMLGIQMISVAEGFVLAEKLGLAAEKLFQVSSSASAQCWSLTSYCPAPGFVEAAPSNNEYKAGFATALMLKDLKLAMEAADSFNAPVALGDLATQTFQAHADSGLADKDFSDIINHVRNQAKTN